ncbi:hypothetical protein SDC9_89752 [bioreactor metagenome]|uniref:Uncharacterized protein n=1 Tax=bioreactor metagenome TaxID=1076179 RepID=A0A644ZQ22_9ZZZZ
MFVFEAAPAPARGHAQHAVGQGREVVGHLLDGDAVLHVARQRAEGLGMVGAAQQVEQVLVVVLAGGTQGGQAQLQFVFEVGRHETLGHERVARQLVDHAGVLQHVAGGPLGSAQQVQQMFVHARALQQQRQIAFAAQQRLQPFHQPHGGGLFDGAFGHPTRGALHQAKQPRARLVAQRLHARAVAPFGHALAHLRGQLLDQRVEFGRGRALAVAARAAATAAVALLFLVVTAEQDVELLRHQLAVRVELAQKAAAPHAHGVADPAQVFVRGGQHMGLLVVQVLDAVLHLAQKNVCSGERLCGFLRHETGARQALQGLERGTAAQLGELPAAHYLQQLHGEFDLADAAAR